MTTTDMFTGFLENLKVKNSESITSKYERITSTLNQEFRGLDSKKDNRLRVGSYGRWTGINGISDLDMLYIMPNSKWDEYKDGKQSKLLDDTRDAILTTYPTTKVKKDRLVIQVLFSGFMVEVQPVFEQSDGSYKYPDSYGNGSWKTTKPREEIQAMQEFVEQKNRNLRKLCKMVRAWKNKHGVGIGGLLIDTLAYNFLRSNSNYDNRSVAYYDLMCRDFFKYLSEEPIKDYYLALGSNQRVNVKSKFQKRALKAYELSLKAIEAGESPTAHKKWKNIFGRAFPASSIQKNKSAQTIFDNTEEFIEDFYPVDIRYNLEVDCVVSQNGYRVNSLRSMLANNLKLLPKKDLRFSIYDINVPDNYTIKWKVLNRGSEAERRNLVRGHIIDSNDGFEVRKETTDFNGEHIVECFAIQNGVVVAKGRIKVPIQ